MTDWRHRALCRDEDPEAWFPLGGDNTYVKESAAHLELAEEAKTICRRCPAISNCLAWALETGQDHGVWGGLTAYERRALKRRNARTRTRSNA